MKRIFACLFIMAVLPVMSSTRLDGSINSAPFATVVLAGHTSAGGSYCDCGTDGCICDPGEQALRKIPDEPSGKPVNQDAAPDAGLTSGALLMALALLFWIRMR